MLPWQLHSQHIQAVTEMPAEVKSPKSRSPKPKKRGGSAVVLKGTFVFPNEEKYDGDYVNAGQGRIERSGQGTHYFANGNVYSGTWVKDKMSGNGELKYSSGAVYKGEFTNNDYNGHGTYTWPDGSSFTGNFVENRICGEGEFTDSQGRVWTGTVSGREAFEFRLKLS